MDSERFWDGEEDNLDDDDEVGDIDAFNDETFGNVDEWNEDEHEELIAQDEILSGPARSNNHRNNNNNNQRQHKNDNYNANGNHDNHSFGQSTSNKNNTTPANGNNNNNRFNINDYSALFNSLHISTPTGVSGGAAGPEIPGTSGSCKSTVNNLVRLEGPGSVPIPVPFPGHSHRSGWSPFGSKDLFGAPIELPVPPFQSPVIDHHQQQEARQMHDNVYAALIAHQQQIQRHQQQQQQQQQQHYQQQQQTQAARRAPDGGDRQDGGKQFLTVEEIERQFFLESQQAAAQAAQAAEIAKVAQMAQAAHMAQAAQAAQIALAAQAQALQAAQNEANRLLNQASDHREQLGRMIYDGPHHVNVQTADGFIREDKQLIPSSFPSTAQTLEDIERDLLKKNVDSRNSRSEHDSSTSTTTTPQATQFFDKFHTEIQQNNSMSNNTRRQHQQNNSNSNNSKPYPQQENHREQKYGQQSTSSSYHTQHHHHNNQQKHQNQRDNNNYQHSRNNRAIQNARSAPIIVPPQVQLEVIDRSKNLYSLTAMHKEEYFMDRVPTNNDGFLFRNHSAEIRAQYDGVLNDKEKTWLTKVQQQIQLQFDNNIEEDYYHILYQMKKGTSSNCTDHNELLERHLQLVTDPQQSSALYSPRQFIGSLGKISLSNVNCPRQLLDMETL